MKLACMLLALMALDFSDELHGQGKIVDQSYSPNFNQNFSFYYAHGAESYYPFGQEFTPTLASLNQARVSGRAGVDGIRAAFA